jgi:hypothetical protein
MLTRLDTVLYPDDIDVIHNTDIDQYVYPIFKCGYTSIVDYARHYKFPFLTHKEIKECKEISVIIRNPHERFISGVNSYYWNLHKQEPKLDRDTVFYFIKQYPFFNRHYAPQIGWLINLFRFMNTNSRVKLLTMDNINDFTTLNSQPGNGEQKILTSNEIEDLQSSDTHQLYMRLDNKLLDMTGTSWTAQELFTHLMTQDAEAYFECVAKNQVLTGVTDVLPKV